MSISKKSSHQSHQAMKMCKTQTIVTLHKHSLQNLKHIKRAHCRYFPYEYPKLLLVSNILILIACTNFLKWFAKATNNPFMCFTLPKLGPFHFILLYVSFSSLLLQMYVLFVLFLSMLGSNLCVFVLPIHSFSLVKKLLNMYVVLNIVFVFSYF